MAASGGSLEELEAQLKELRGQRRKEKRREAQKRRRSGTPTPNAAAASGEKTVVDDVVGAGNVAEGIACNLIRSGANQVCPKLDKGKSRELLLLLELADFNPDVVVSYVLGQGRQAACQAGFDFWNLEIRQGISAGVMELYNKSDFELVRDLLEAPQNIMHNLCRYVTEYHLYHWLVAQNCEKGVAPCSAQAFAKAACFLPMKAPDDLRQRMKDWFLGGERAARLWLASYKQRWDAKVGLMPAGDQLEPGVMAAKAAWQLAWFFLEPGLIFFQKITNFWGQFWVPNLVPKMVPHFGFSIKS
jgi:hypothetical protein